VSDQYAPVPSSSGPGPSPVAGEAPAPDHAVPDVASGAGSSLPPPSSGAILPAGDAPLARTCYSTGQGASFWDGPEGPARVALLLKLQAKKWSGSRIAAEFGVTRNTVLGKLARLGLRCESAPPTNPGSRRPNIKRAVELKNHKPAPRGGDAQRRGVTAFSFTKGGMLARAAAADEARRRRPENELRSALRRSEVVDRAPEPIPATACSIFDLRNESCRFPVGPLHDPATLFCGAPAADLAAGMPYCSKCAPRCYTQARWRP
jgi:hypothetical protein